MATQAATGSDGSVTEDEHEVEHHLSTAPLIVGVGAFFAYLGLAFELPVGAWILPVPVIAPLGLAVVAWGLLRWAGEAMHDWETGYRLPGVRPGKPVGWWGIVGFLATEVMLFGGLFATYFVFRAADPQAWAEAHHLVTEELALVTVNTAILVSSGFVLHWGEKKLKDGNDLDGLRNGLVGAILLGIIFLAVQVKEYMGLISHGLTLGSSQFGSIFYLLTGTHGVHVLLGICLLGVALYRTLKGAYSTERHTSLAAFAIYWHFVDVVWIVLYLVIYVGVI